MHCTKCGSKSFIRKGIAPTSAEPNRYRYNCKQCGSNFYVSMQVTIQQDITEQQQSTLFNCFEEEYEVEQPVEQYSFAEEAEAEDDPIDYEEFPTSFIRDDSYVNSLKTKTRLVITSAQNNTDLVDGFLDSIKTFCDHNDAGLIVIPIQYKKPGSQENFSYAPEIVPYLIDNKIVFQKHRIAICADLKLTPTAINPLSGIDGFSKGNTVIVGHPQVQLKTLPRNMDHKYPPIVATTGSITKENYSRSKTGIQAEHNHSYSALLVEFTENEYFIRHLNYDDANRGFYDLDKWYDNTGMVKDGIGIDAIVTGDTHVRFHDKEVYQATYSESGIINFLKPKYWIVHDVLDFNARSHHTIKDPMANLGKRKRKTDIVEEELKEAMDFIVNNLPNNCTAVIVGSNHDMHLDQWLRYGDIKIDPENAKIYHYLWYLSCKFMDDNETDYAPPAFGLYFFDNQSNRDDVVFLDERDTFKLHGIELSIHGANGTNGARGSINQYSRLPDKTVTGHSHSPSIMKGAYCVGTSSVFNMPYVRGASSWDHAHCIIHRNGKRQMIFMRNGKFKA